MSHDNHPKWLDLHHHATVVDIHAHPADLSASSRPDLPSLGLLRLLFARLHFHSCQFAS